jgi:Asp-tRNA(Asn)/Glu-tRNA(Gln) amidotransferase A subunit family amidase
LIDTKVPYPEIARRVISEKAKARWAEWKKPQRDAEEAQRTAKLTQKRKEHEEWLNSLTKIERWERRQWLNRRYERDRRRDRLLREIKARLEDGEKISLQKASQMGARTMKTMFLHPRTVKRIANFLEKWEKHKNDPKVRSGRPRKHPEKYQLNN